MPGGPLTGVRAGGPRRAGVVGQGVGTIGVGGGDAALAVAGCNVGQDDDTSAATGDDGG